jgi:hypothetical protein
MATIKGVVVEKKLQLAACEFNLLMFIHGSDLSRIWAGGPSA